MRHFLLPLLLLLVAVQRARATLRGCELRAGGCAPVSPAPLCWLTDGALRGGAGVRNRVAMARGGRSFLLSLPAEALPSGASDNASALLFPLLYVIHGYTDGNVFILDRTQLDALGPLRGYVVVAPLGVGRNTAWTLGNAPGDGLRTDVLPDPAADVAFLDDVAACVAHVLRVPIDAASGAYVAGLSQGGKMACRHACHTSAPGRVRALALAAGVQAELGMRCDRGAVPMLLFQGGADIITPLCGSGYFRYRPGQDDFLTWTRGVNGCADVAPTALCPTLGAMSGGGGIAAAVAGATATRVYVHTAGCADGAHTALYWLPLGVHTWPEGQLPGVGATASDVALDFFDSVRGGGPPQLTPRGGFAPCARPQHRDWPCSA